VPFLIIGIARNGLGRAVSTVAVFVVTVVTISVAASSASDRKNRAASMVHPDPPIVVAPAIAFLARRAALLALQAHASTDLGRTVVPLLIV
jgi:hypothetical protein